MPIYMEISRLHRTVTIVARGTIAADEVRGLARQLVEAHVHSFAKVVDVASATAAGDLSPEQVAGMATLLRGDGVQAPHLSAAMRTDAQPRRPRHAVNLDQLGQAAAPADIRLQDVMEPPLDQFGETDGGELVLAAGRESPELLAEEVLTALKQRGII